MTRRAPSRRDLWKLAASLGLGACDTRKPNKGALGAIERWNQEIESALLSSDVPPPGAITTSEAWPIYKLAPEIPLPPDGWRLEVGGKVRQPLQLTLDDLRKLPRTDVRIQHYCVRGWSAVAEWSGIRVSELARLCGAHDVPYVEFRSFDAPDAVTRGFWSSWDRASAMHDQTLIAYGMNGKPLTPAHGAPVRVCSAVKLGYKQVKYLTEVNFLDVKTGGQWENQGYAWFAGV